jgi:hypothetical protein
MLLYIGEKKYDGTPERARWLIERFLSLRESLNSDDDSKSRAAYESLMVLTGVDHHTSSHVTFTHTDDAFLCPGHRQLRCWDDPFGEVSGVNVEGRSDHLLLDCVGWGTEMTWLLDHLDILKRRIKLQVQASQSRSLTKTVVLWVELEPTPPYIKMSP